MCTSIPAPLLSDPNVVRRQHGRHLVTGGVDDVGRRYPLQLCAHRAGFDAGHFDNVVEQSLQTIQLRLHDFDLLAALVVRQAGTTPRLPAATVSAVSGVLRS